MNITKQLIEAVRQKYQLDWNGIHGVAHWSRVKLNGLTLATHYPGRANVKVIELFAFLHDSCRLNDGSDHQHGGRAADFATRLNDIGIISLDDTELSILRYACMFHTHGATLADITTQICWDADRLDLGRVGVYPDPKYLCTEAARCDTMILQSYSRSLGFRSKK